MVTGIGAPSTATAAKPQPPSARRLPRWRGFNLLEKFDGRHNRPFLEFDFDQIAEWGLDFVRLPMSYLCWSSQAQPDRIDEKVIAEIDQAIAWGKARGIHVNLNLHRAPGYCVNPPAEPMDLWADPKAQDAAAALWGFFARRYKEFSSTAVSFDLLNEPSDIPAVRYVPAVRRMVEAIRAEDPHRLIIADGLRWGRAPVPELAELGIAQSTRGYDPMEVSHYKADWAKWLDNRHPPTWPLRIKREGKPDEVWDAARLQREQIDPWKKLESQGVGVHVGEWGAYNRTPHGVALAWMKDFLTLWQRAGWGWALWNLRGSFGVLDSERKDVKYETFKGHQLDRKMLDLLRAH